MHTKTHSRPLKAVDIQEWKICSNIFE